ncbi:hypothetical protein, partial [Acinetobacter bereziniae]|uniref:hypothetical protein n=1 Tax=Acinetobacter bereziniae TaxID=106648 RepID=UPI001C071AC0
SACFKILMIKLSEYLDVFIKNLLYRIIRFSTFEFNYFEGGLPVMPEHKQLSLEINQILN